MENIAAIIIQKNVKRWLAIRKYNILLAEKIIKVYFLGLFYYRKMKNYMKKSKKELKKVYE